MLLCPVLVHEHCISQELCRLTAHSWRSIVVQMFQAVHHFISGERRVQHSCIVAQFLDCWALSCLGRTEDWCIVVELRCCCMLRFVSRQTIKVRLPFTGQLHAVRHGLLLSSELM